MRTSPPKPHRPPLLVRAFIISTLFLSPSALAQGLAANQILSLQGILNGTCNFILTAMSEQGASYQDVLAEAIG